MEDKKQKKLKIPARVNEKSILFTDYVISEAELEGLSDKLCKIIMKLASGTGTPVEKDAMYMVAKVLGELEHYTQHDEDTLILEDVFKSITFWNHMDSRLVYEAELF